MSMKVLAEWTVPGDDSGNAILIDTTKKSRGFWNASMHANYKADTVPCPRCGTETSPADESNLIHIRCFQLVRGLEITEVLYACTDCLNWWRRILYIETK